MENLGVAAIFVSSLNEGQTSNEKKKSCSSGSKSFSLREDDIFENAFLCKKANRVSLKLLPFLSMMENHGYAPKTLREVEGIYQYLSSKPSVTYFYI